MKYADVEKLHEAGLITGEQRERIINHFQLKEEGSHFLAIISMIGAVLVAAGAILLISAHWNEIPRGVKIAAGLALMLGAHAGGWYLREVRGKYRKTGEALHLIGSGLFLGNIALLGQIYNLISRPPNAILLWWLGIAALPWLLRSKAQHVLFLLAFGLWFGLEVNEPDSLLFGGNDERQLLLYALLGLLYLGCGYCLRNTRFAEFSGVTEKLGLLGLLTCSYPLSWKDFYGGYGWEHSQPRLWTLAGLAVPALIFLAIGIAKLTTLNRQWRATWGLTLAVLSGMLASAWYGLWAVGSYESSCYLPGVLVLFVFCLLQIQVGLQERSPFLVNVGITFIALDIIAAYLDLFGSMARTGFMFLISGLFLIGFGVYLEKKRRKLMSRMKSTAITEAP
jgi:uncharacterized membrane protein